MEVTNCSGLATRKEIDDSASIERNKKKMKKQYNSYVLKASTYEKKYKKLLKLCDDDDELYDAKVEELVNLLHKAISYYDCAFKVFDHDKKLEKKIQKLKSNYEEYFDSQETEQISERENDFSSQKEILPSPPEIGDNLNDENKYFNYDNEQNIIRNKRNQVIENYEKELVSLKENEHSNSENTSEKKVIEIIANESDLNFVEEEEDFNTQEREEECDGDKYFNNEEKECSFNYNEREIEFDEEESPEGTQSEKEFDFDAESDFGEDQYREEIEGGYSEKSFYDSEESEEDYDREDSFIVDEEEYKEELCNKQKKKFIISELNLNDLVADEYGFVEDKQNGHHVQVNIYKTYYKKKKEQALYRIDSSIYEKLYSYQKECLRWLWGKHNDFTMDEIKGGGGILGDEMGLGKTVQICSYLNGLIETKAINAQILNKKNSLKSNCFSMIVVPVSLIENWKKEIDVWINKNKSRRDKVDVFVFHSLTTKKRKDMIYKFMHKGGILLTTYGMVVSQCDALVEAEYDSSYIDSKSQKSDRYLTFDYIILDEGHKIKNSKIKLSKCVRKIRAQHRLILTGTPIQNNLSELWSLYDFIFEGKLLASYKAFKDEFESVIVKAQEKDSTEYEKKLGSEVSKQLRSLIEPYFLRREKSKVLNIQTQSTSDNVQDSQEKTTFNEKKTISQKNDFIVWIKNSKKQVNLYNDFLQSSTVKEVLNKSGHALAAITVLKQICCHPLLLANVDEQERNNCSYHNLISNSGKMKFIEELLETFVERSENRIVKVKHRVLIFSQSVLMLDLICKVLNQNKYKFLRIDGSITKTEERQKRIDLFNNDPSYFCFLLTTQTGGVGITLTGADRVILFDPSWNPAIDDQAVDRAYRIGQTKNVVVYRLITCGTIEEKIYRKQIFKGLLSRIAIGQKKWKDQNKSYKRYFTHQELRHLFTIGDYYNSDTQREIMKIFNEMNIKRKEYAELKEHVEQMCNIFDKDVFHSLSDHDLLYDASEKEYDESNINQDQLNRIRENTKRRLDLVSMNPQYESTNTEHNNEVVILNNIKKATQKKKEKRMQLFDHYMENQNIEDNYAEMNQIPLKQKEIIVIDDSIQEIKNIEHSQHSRGILGKSLEEDNNSLLNYDLLEESLSTKENPSCPNRKSISLQNISVIQQNDENCSFLGTTENEMDSERLDKEARRLSVYLGLINTNDEIDDVEFEKDEERTSNIDSSHKNKLEENNTNSQEYQQKKSRIKRIILDGSDSDEEGDENNLQSVGRDLMNLSIQNVPKKNIFEQQIEEENMQEQDAMDINDEESFSEQDESEYDQSFIDKDENNDIELDDNSFSCYDSHTETEKKPEQGFIDINLNEDSESDTDELPSEEEEEEQEEELDLTDEQIEFYNNYMKKANEFKESGDIESALKYYYKSFNIYQYDDDLNAVINEIEQFIQKSKQ